MGESPPLEERKGKTMSKKNTAVWKSLVNQEMIDGAELSDSEIAQLIQDLDDAVAQVCEEYGVR